MSAPLTDEQVAHAVADYDDVTVTNALAREVQAYRALPIAPGGFIDTVAQEYPGWSGPVDVVPPP